MDSTGIIGLLGVVVGAGLALGADAVRRRWSQKDLSVADRRQVYARFLQALTALTTQWVMNRFEAESSSWWSVFLAPPQEPEDLGSGVVRVGEMLAELELVADGGVQEAATVWGRFVAHAMNEQQVPSREEFRALRRAFVNEARKDLGIKRLPEVEGAE